MCKAMSAASFNTSFNPTTGPTPVKAINQLGENICNLWLFVSCKNKQTKKQKNKCLQILELSKHLKIEGCVLFCFTSDTNKDNKVCLVFAQEVLFAQELCEGNLPS